MLVTPAAGQPSRRAQAWLTFNVSARHQGMIFTQALGHLQRRFHNDYELSSTIKHRGEKGRQREHGLLTFLRDTLPGAYGVATGEILPYLGREPSPQCDIVIYDHLHMPILGKSTAVQQIPMEAVYAVIECKSRLDAAAFADAGAKFDTIRRLPRAKSRRRLRSGCERGPSFFLFGYQLHASAEACAEFARSSTVSSDTNVCALDRGATMWLSDQGSERCVWLNATDQAQGLYETLALFYVVLLEELHRTDLGSPSYIEIFFNGE